MGEAALVAEGTNATVSIVGHKVVVQQKGVKGLLKRGFTLYRDPRSIASVFSGPSKKVITAALAENKELAKVIIGAVRGAGSGADADVSDAAGSGPAPGAAVDPEGSEVAGDDGGVARALTEAFKHNRHAVVQAIRDNDTLVKAWLRDHKDLAGIVLKGDVHVFRADVTSAALAKGRDGRRAFVLDADGERLTVTFDETQEDAFRRLIAALGGGPVATETAATAMVGASPATTPAPPTAATAATAPGTKTCPMCAEEVKAAAVICRFCGHRFDAP